MTKSIDLNEKFIHLSKAPIVEAALEIRVIPSVKWDEAILQSELKQRLPNYPKVESLRKEGYKFSPGKSDNVEVKDFGCIGFRLQSDDNLHIAQFNKAAFVFSRLKPYADWEQFSHEAMRLWAIYYKLQKPAEIIRIGLRFINRIAIKQKDVELSDYYKYPPEPLKTLSWPLTGYLHQDVIQVPETPYSVNLIKTVQPVPGEVGLILDIDVFMQSRFGYDESIIIGSLGEMRWVKNKVFFNSLTEKVIEEMK